MTIGEAYVVGVKKLSQHKCQGSDPKRESELLLCWTTGLSPEELLTCPEKKLRTNQEKKFLATIARRRKHEPVEYITGLASFYGREFIVNRNTLIPRPATELIIERFIKDAQKATAVIDIGTGSGCIAVTLAGELPNANVIATDISSSALRAAKKNAERNHVSDRIHFLRSDIFPKNLALGPAPFIIANLPYIPTTMMKKLPLDVRRFEPASALDGGRDGLDYYRTLIAQAPKDATLFLEILPNQFRPLTAFIKKISPGATVEKIINGKVCIGLRSGMVS